MWSVQSISVACPWISEHVTDKSLIYFDFKSLFYLDIYFPFLYTLLFPFSIGLFYPFSIWTFISLFYLNFYLPFLHGLLFLFPLNFLFTSILLVSIIFSFLFCSIDFYFFTFDQEFGFLLESLPKTLLIICNDVLDICIRSKL